MKRVLVDHGNLEIYRLDGNNYSFSTGAPNPAKTNSKLKLKANGAKVLNLSMQLELEKFLAISKLRSVTYSFVIIY